MKNKPSVNHVILASSLTTPVFLIAVKSAAPVTKSILRNVQRPQTRSARAALASCVPTISAPSVRKTSASREKESKEPLLSTMTLIWLNICMNVNLYVRIMNITMRRSKSAGYIHCAVPTDFWNCLQEIKPTMQYASHMRKKCRRYTLLSSLDLSCSLSPLQWFFLITWLKS